MGSDERKGLGAAPPEALGLLWIILSSSRLARGDAARSPAVVDEFSPRQDVGSPFHGRHGGRRREGLGCIVHKHDQGA